MTDIFPRRTRRTPHAVATIVVATALVFASPLAAHAEGSFTSYMTQVQPTFASRFWTDKNNDSVSTKVVLSGCQANAGGASPGTTVVKSVTVKLYRFNQVVGTIKKACGTYDFGRTPGGGSPQSNGFHFEISEINGYTKAEKHVLLDVETVTVSY